MTVGQQRLIIKLTENKTMNWRRIKSLILALDDSTQPSEG